MLENKYFYDWMPSRYFFGDGYTIYIRLCAIGGHEIHVNASKPVRRIAPDIMDSIGGVFYTTVLPSNKIAINLCLKCGFEYMYTKTVFNNFTGKNITLNYYKRP